MRCIIIYDLVLFVDVSALLFQHCCMGISCFINVLIHGVIVLVNVVCECFILKFRILDYRGERE